MTVTVLVKPHCPFTVVVILVFVCVSLEILGLLVLRPQQPRRTFLRIHLQIAAGQGIIVLGLRGFDNPFEPN